MRTAWGHALVLPSIPSFDLTAALIALAAGVALVRYKANVALVVLGCAIIGLLARIMLAMP
jgi:chromate transporter